MRINSSPIAMNFRPIATQGSFNRFGILELREENTVTLAIEERGMLGVRGKT